MSICPNVTRNQFSLWTLEPVSLVAEARGQSPRPQVSEKEKVWDTCWTSVGPKS